MAAPTATPLVASRLLRRVLAGPQQLLYSDIANDAGRRIFEALGGCTIMLYSLKWQRPLRPARHAIAWLGARGAPGAVTGLLRPIGSALDSVLKRGGPTEVAAIADGYVIEDLPLDVLAQRLPDLVGNRPLHPEYDERWLDWIVRVAQQTMPHAVLRRRLVRDAAQRPAGWFLYFLEPGASAEVLQLVARKDAYAAVFDALLADARDAGATMLSGRLEPSMVQEMSARHCVFRQADHWTLVQTNDPEILGTIAAGRGFLSRLEGEWERALPAVTPAEHHGGREQHDLQVVQRRAVLDVFEIIAELLAHVVDAAVVRLIDLRPAGDARQDLLAPRVFGNLLAQ